MGWPRGYPIAGGTAPMSVECPDAMRRRIGFSILLWFNPCRDGCNIPNARGNPCSAECAKARITTETRRHGVERSSSSLDILLLAAMSPWRSIDTIIHLIRGFLWTRGITTKTRRARSRTSMALRAERFVDLLRALRVFVVKQPGDPPACSQPARRTPFRHVQRAKSAVAPYDRRRVPGM